MWYYIYSQKKFIELKREGIAMSTLWVILAAVVIGAIVASAAKRLRQASDTERETQLLTRLEEAAALALFNADAVAAEVRKIGDSELHYFGLDRSMEIETMIAALRNRRTIRLVATGTSSQPSAD